MPDDQAPQPKPGPPSSQKDPPGIASSAVDKQPPPKNPADEARLEEELEGLENLPSAAEF